MTVGLWVRIPLDVLGEAAQGLLRRPLRAVLSLLAMAVAVGTVALVLDGLRGFQEYVRVTTIRTFGSDTFVVQRARTVGLTRKESAAKLERNRPIDRLDIRSLERYAPDLLISPVLQRRVALVAGSRKAENTALNGVSAEMFAIRELGLVEGRFFTAPEDLAAAPVIVLGAEVAQRLFPAGGAVGKTVRLAGRGFRVVGVQERQGTLGGVSLDLYAWIPWRAFERVFGAESRTIFVRPVESMDARLAQDLARVPLRARRHLRPGEEDNFDLVIPEAAQSFVVDLSRRVGGAAPPITVAALLAAVVVITNTSLVSVTERLKEIGIRRALGATRRRIIGEVLAESVLISVVGGIVGLALARVMLESVGAWLQFPLPAQWSTAAWSLVAASVSGVAAGWYPALRAIEVEIVAILRAE